MQALKNDFIKFLKDRPYDFDYVEFHFIHHSEIFRIIYEKAPSRGEKQKFLCIQVTNNHDEHYEDEDDHERYINSITFPTLKSFFESSPQILKISLEMELDTVEYKTKQNTTRKM